MTRAQLLLIWPLPVSESHILSRTVSKLSCSIDQIFAFEYGVGYLYLMHCFSEISANITVNRVLRKVDFGATFLWQKVWI